MKTLPISRMIGGSVCDLQKNTIDPDKPATYNFGIAIEKTGGDWRATDWGQYIHAEGVRRWPQYVASPTFSWKIIDGDSPIPNKAGRIPNQQTGYAGHWVLWINTAFKTPLLNRTGDAPLADEKLIQPGCYVQVLIDCRGNDSTQSPGVYINPLGVAFSYYGEPIAKTERVDFRDVGFGQGTMPAGASIAPVAGMATADDVPIARTPPGYQMPSFMSPAPIPPLGARAPDRAFINPPSPPSPPPVLVRQMTALAEGASYEALLDAGWTDALLIKHGMMLP